MYKLSKNSLKNSDGVSTNLKKVRDLAIQITTVDFGYGPLAGKRTAEEQHELYLDNKSKCDGYKNLSRHQEKPKSRALDFFAFVDGAASWVPSHLAMVAAAHLQAASMLGVRIQWGGLWLADNSDEGSLAYGWDMEHIEEVD